MTLVGFRKPQLSLQISDKGNVKSKIFLVLLSFAFCLHAFAQTEADFCVECSTGLGSSIEKATDPLKDIAKKADEDFYQKNFLDPELVEKTDSRKMGEMIVSRLRNNCDNFRDPSKTTAPDESSEIVMLVNDKNIGNVLKYGFKNQQQTSTTNGSDAKQSRIMAESNHVMMGLPYTDKTRELLPKYAMQVFHNTDMGAYNVPFHYGNIMIRFKPEVKKRSTWSQQDSLGMMEPLRSQNLRPRQDMKCIYYCEAQVWGDLDASDIESIILPDDYAITDDVKNYGVPVYSYKYTGEKNSFGDISGSLRPEDPPPEGAFKDSTIPKVRVSADPIYKPETKVTPPKFFMSLVDLKSQVESESSVPVRNILRSSMYSKMSTSELMEAYTKKKAESTSTPDSSRYYGGYGDSGSLGEEKLRMLSEITGREKTPEVFDFLKKVLAASDVDRSTKSSVLPGLIHLPWNELKPILIDILKPASPGSGSPYYGSDPLMRWAQLMALDHLDDSEVDAAFRAIPGGSGIIDAFRNHTYCREEKMK